MSGAIGFLIGYVLGMCITFLLVLRRELPHIGEDMYDSYD